MNRQPIYHRTKAARFRVVSVPNGLWMPQRHDGMAATRASDPWRNIASKPMPLDEAEAAMNAAAEKTR